MTIWPNLSPSRSYLARVRALVRRGFHSGNAKLRYADLSLDRHRRRATRGSEVIPLTAKEFALLELFLLPRSGIGYAK